MSFVTKASSPGLNKVILSPDESVSKAALSVHILPMKNIYEQPRPHMMVMAGHDVLR